MKKLLIICLVLLTGCTNANAKINKIEHQDIFDQVQLSDYQNVMIVAHPDDETIWGGMHLLKDKYLVVCLTNGDNEIRSKEFKEVMKKTQNTGLILNYPDKTNGKRDNWKSSYQKIEDDLNYLLSKQHFNLVVTHNPKGEYGHQHHKMTSAIVTSIAKDLAITNNLKYFGLYYRKTNPILPMKPTFDDDLTKQKLELAVCYSSQKKVCHNLGHMFPYENWISYDEWH